MYSAIEEAKADIVGLWALHFLIDKVRFSLSDIGAMCFLKIYFFVLGLKFIMLKGWGQVIKKPAF